MSFQLLNWENPIWFDTERDFKNPNFLRIRFEFQFFQSFNEIGIVFLPGRKRFVQEPGCW